jgi:hypothetical protein
MLTPLGIQIAAASLDDAGKARLVFDEIRITVNDDNSLSYALFFAGEEVRAKQKQSNLDAGCVLRIRGFTALLPVNVEST